jgi:hypothetical protein
MPKNNHKPEIQKFIDALDRVQPGSPQTLAVDLDDLLWQLTEVREAIVAFRDAGSRSKRKTQLKRLELVHSKVDGYLKDAVRDVRRDLGKYLDAT